MLFKDREEAGLFLASGISKLQISNPIILAVPRGGVVVGKVAAEKLKAFLDIIVVKKIGYSLNPELAIGAIGPENTVYWEKELIAALNLKEEELLKIESKKQEERIRTEKKLRGNKKQTHLKNRNIILVDDGIATGSTVLCAQKYLRKSRAKSITLAVPVAPKEVVTTIKKYFDHVVVLDSEKDFRAVGMFYEEFPQVEDEEVVRLLDG